MSRPGPVLRGWAAGALLLAVLLLIPGDARSAPRGFVGIQGWGNLTAREGSLIAGARVGTYRTNLLWGYVETRRGARDWRSFDAEVRHAAHARATVLPIVQNSPRFYARKLFYPPRGGRGRAALARFVADAVARYGHKGSFWAANPAVPYRPITHWQIWNEPNYFLYWARRPRAREYVAMVKAARRAAKSRDMQAKIVMAGIPETRSKQSISMSRYLSQVYRVRGARKLFDVVAIHPYASGVKNLRTSLMRARKIMRRHGDGRKPIWVTELGWATGGAGKAAVTTTRAGQARRLRQAYSFLIRHRRRYRVGKAVWFSLRDRAAEAGERNWWGLHTGLLDRFGRAKPAWHAFRGIARR